VDVTILFTNLEKVKNIKLVFMLSRNFLVKNNLCKTELFGLLMVPEDLVGNWI
jgi:hypothetical protein